MANARARRPNIVVFFTDQQRWDTTGVHDNPLDLTPNFDRMAWSGTHLQHFFTCQPVCGPARAALQTGRYPTSIGCYRNNIPLPGNAKTLAHHFGAAGYATAYIGKWHLASTNPVPAAERGGYEYWLASNLLEFTSDAYDTILYDNDMRPVKLPGYRVDALADAGIRYIDAHQEHPFFLFMSFLEPHHQNHLDDYPARDGYRERYVGRWMPPDLAALGGSAHQHIAGYFAMVRRLDEALGRVLDTLKSLDLIDNTIVLFTSDHGNHFKTRNEEYKRSCHDASIRVPAALIGPGFDSGGRVRELVSLIDLPPTLLEASGIEAPPAMQGRSIMPLLRRQAVDWPKEVFVQISEAEVGRSIRTVRWKYAVAAPDRDAWRHPNAARYVETHLYDLHADPYELVNLVGMDAFANTVAELRARLIARMTAAGEAVAEIVPASNRPAGQRGERPAAAFERHNFEDLR